MQFYDFNKIERKKLSIYLESLSKNDDFYTRFIEEIQELENYNEKYYRYLIGLMFIDNYRLLDDIVYKTKEEKLKLKFYDQITDIDDLIFAIKENPEILSDICDAPIEMLTVDIFTQSFTLKEMDNERIKKFSPTTLIEKMIFFRDYTIEELISIYDEKDDEYLAKKEISNILILLSIGNFKNFKSLILKLILIDYKWIKLLETEEKITNSIIWELILMIEENSLDDLTEILSSDNQMIETIVDIYFEYIKNYAFEISKVEDNYNKNVKEKIKTKLKEVSL